MQRPNKRLIFADDRNYPVTASSTATSPLGLPRVLLRRLLGLVGKVIGLSLSLFGHFPAFALCLLFGMAEFVCDLVGSFLC